MFTDSSHVFLCPTMMTGYWQKMLGKLADSMYILKPGSDAWPNFMYESLTIAFVKPLLTTNPWKARFLPELERWTNSVFAVQWKNKSDIWSHMRKFWL